MWLKTQLFTQQLNSSIVLLHDRDAAYVLEIGKNSVCCRLSYQLTEGAVIEIII